MDIHHAPKSYAELYIVVPTPRITSIINITSIYILAMNVPIYLPLYSLSSFNLNSIPIFE